MVAFGRGASALDAVQALALMVEAQVNVGDVGLEVRQVALHRRDAVTHIAELALDLADARADRAQVLEDDVVPFGGHGSPLVGEGVYCARAGA